MAQLLPPPPPTTHAPIVVLYGLQGGVGRTTLAANLGVWLAQQGERELRLPHLRGGCGDERAGRIAQHVRRVVRHLGGGVGEVELVRVVAEDRTVLGK